MGSLLCHTIAEFEALAGYVILGILVSSLYNMLRRPVKIDSLSVDDLVTPPALHQADTTSDLQ
jgi:hypothetical protein